MSWQKNLFNASRFATGQAQNMNDDMKYKKNPYIFGFSIVDDHISNTIHGRYCNKIGCQNADINLKNRFSNLKLLTAMILDTVNIVPFNCNNFNIC